MASPRVTGRTRILVSIAGGVLCAALSWFDLLIPLDRLVYDTANESRLLRPSGDVLVVAIDERSLLELGRWPWPREKHVELLGILERAGVTGVALDIIFAEPDIEYPQVDKLLAEAIARSGNVVLPIFIGQAYLGGQLFEVEPLPNLAASAAALGHVHIEVDDDGVARSVFLREGLGSPHWPHFSVAVAQMLNIDHEPLPGVSDEEVLQRPSAIAIIRSNKNLIPFAGPAGTIETVSYADVLAGRIPERTLRNKLVFVGATAAGLGDQLTTSQGQISGVELNVNVFEALRQDKLNRPLSRLANLLVSFLVASFAIAFLTLFKPRPMLLMVGAGMLLVPVASALTLIWLRLWVSPAPLIVTISMIYPIWNWLRLESVIEFMHQQLKTLRAENQSPLESYQLVDLEKAIEFLEQLEILDAWLLIDPAGEPVNGVGQLELSDDLNWSQDRWQRSGSQSFRQFCIDGVVYRVALLWKDSSDSSREVLEQVFDRSAVRQPLIAQHDIVESSIEQLSEAYDRARHHHELLQEMIARVDVGVVLSELDGHCLQINEQAKQLLGVEYEDTSLIDVIRRANPLSTQNWAKLLSELIFKGNGFFCEATARHSGRDLVVRGRLIASTKPLVLISLTDVSELKSSEARRGEALDFLSHDLRAPLTSVIALIDGAKSENPDEVNLALLDNIESYVRRNLNYAENFTQLAKLESSTQQQHVECELHSLIDNAVSQLYHVAKSRQIGIDIELVDEDIWLSCNRGLVERACANLLDNAIRHSGDGGQVKVVPGIENDQIMITVQDQGTGIDAKTLDAIREGLHPGNVARSAVGLGLRFVDQVARAHGGRLDMESQPGKGSIFRLILSRQQPTIGN